MRKNRKLLGLIAVLSFTPLLQVEPAAAAGRHTVIANVDQGGGVHLANRPGGYYMGRLFPGWTFDRHGSWYYSSENRSNYAWSMAWGHTNKCLWVGPSRGKFDYTASLWASGVQPNFPDRCTDGTRSWLAENSGTNIGSHFNCPPESGATHGTQKQLLQNAPFYWNLAWGGSSTGYDGGTLQDFVATIPALTNVWYRYTTRDGQRIVAYVPGRGWGFFPVGVLDRTRTGTWSDPNESGTPIRTCPI